MSHFAVLAVGENWVEHLQRYDEQREVEGHHVEIGERSMRLWLDWLSGHPDALIEEYFGEPVVEHEGKLCVWTTTNDEGHWDWYEVGGRWAGELRLRAPENEGNYGSHGLMGSCSNEPDGQWVSQALKHDVDWEFMAAHTVAAIREQYAGVLSGSVRTGVFGAAPVLDGEDETAYVRRIFKPWCLYAFINAQGEWFQRAEMGWFGSSGPEEHDDWPATFQRLLREVGDNELLTVVDCHI